MNNQRTHSKRIYYIDNIRVFLSLLVVAHHWALANGGPGDWYTLESQLGEFGTLILSQFVAVNQAYFMGFFFLISGYMVPGSYDRKGGRKFLKERIIRLGIPLVFYLFILSPLLNFMVDRFHNGYSGNFLHFFVTEKGIFSHGPMWFVQLLLIFSLFYHFLRSIFHKWLSFATGEKVKKSHVALVVILLGALTYILRIYSPVGSWAPILAFQPAHVSQYILCFVVGIAVYRWNLLDRITWKVARRSLLLSQILIFIGLPALFLLTGKSDQIELFLGGGSLYSLAYAYWEQAVALSMIVGLIGLFRQYFTTQSRLAKDLSGKSYAIYVFHGVVLVSFSLLTQSFAVNSLHKFIILLLPALLFCYLLAKLILKIPGVSRVL